MDESRLIWHVLRALGLVVASLCADEMEFDGNYADAYDNEISQDQQEDFSRWDKLFVALEDSHMQQKMLLQSVEQCRGAVTRLRTQVEELARGSPSAEAACRAQAERVGAGLRRAIVELREEEAAREARLNATLRAPPSRGRGASAAATPEVSAKEGVAMTTELEEVHLLLTRVLTQVEALRRGRGDV
ncbi:pentraxin-related protein PTX3-like isoform X2 [Betta splendens]|uniref:Pentraxin-related protein PTX3-like isoform X2 n=1 Tax=Betta splendens TaxID=158456 RepID=A0A6P7LNM9_BETSP|nr:pentraxin-related protein PTX3-like isoform X2 [Betta splendens]